MNTANLQLEGLYVAVAALVSALRDKGVLSGEEVEHALSSAEATLAADPRRPSELSHAHLEAIAFPLRFLRLANAAGAGGEPLRFADIAARVGQEGAGKP